MNYFSKAVNPDKNTLFIDVRSPAEFKEATIPGAINIPVFSNQERAEVGRIYHQQGKKAARLKGVEFLSPKLPDYMEKLNQLTEKYKTLIAFCARGGMRSEALVTLASLAGIKLNKYPGGYKSYRQKVIQELKDFQLNSKLVVLHGHTGVGKTEILHKLNERGYPILDLEKLAGHRGSAFGSIGLDGTHNQKKFDSLLLNKLEKINGSKYIFLESESKRIGYSVLPDFLLEAMESGIHILVRSSLEARVARIYQEYSHEYESNSEEFKERVRESLAGIDKYLIRKIGKDGKQKLLDYLESGDFEDFIKLILTGYYDKFYSYAEKHQPDFDLSLFDDSTDKLTEMIINFIEEYQL
ncbi:MAG: tRNA 2-selenouridine(34) synthase MnmH [Bacillota bacterium]